jgi:hypothetical protein
VRKPTRREKKARRHLSPSPLARVKATLDVWELTAADEIVMAFRMAHGMPISHEPDLDIPPVPVRFGAADEHAAHKSDIGRVWPKWRADLKGTLPLTVADAVIIQDRPLFEIDADYHWRNGTARKHLATAIRHFAALRGNAPKGERWRYSAKPER